MDLVIYCFNEIKKKCFQQIRGHWYGRYCFVAMAAGVNGCWNEIYVLYVWRTIKSMFVRFIS